MLLLRARRDLGTERGHHLIRHGRAGVEIAVGTRRSHGAGSFLGVTGAVGIVGGRRIDRAAVIRERVRRRDRRIGRVRGLVDRVVTRPGWLAHENPPGVHGITGEIEVSGVPGSVRNICERSLPWLWHGVSTQEE